MKSEYIAELLNQPTRELISSIAARIDSQHLEINVIHTEPRATAAVLRRADALARGLKASIHLHAAIGVPVRLPIDHSPVSVPFTENMLCGLLGQVGSGGLERALHLYICRDRIETFVKVLRPNSLVMIGGKRRIWPTAASRIGNVLRRHGHDVVLIDFNSRANSSWKGLS